MLLADRGGGRFLTFPGVTLGPASCIIYEPKEGSWSSAVVVHSLSPLLAAALLALIRYPLSGCAFAIPDRGIPRGVAGALDWPYLSDARFCAARPHDLIANLSPFRCSADRVVRDVAGLRSISSERLPAGYAKDGGKISCTTTDTVGGVTLPWGNRGSCVEDNPRAVTGSTRVSGRRPVARHSPPAAANAAPRLVLRPRTCLRTPHPTSQARCFAPEPA